MASFAVFIAAGGFVLAAVFFAGGWLMRGKVARDRTVDGGYPYTSARAAPGSEPPGKIVSKTWYANLYGDGPSYDTVESPPGERTPKMKRTSIKAGAVYAIKSRYGSPSPIVFLEDGAAGLYGRSNYGRGPIRKMEENSYTKAKKGSGFSDSDRGYAAIKISWSSDLKDADAAEQMRAIDPETELARFLADEKPSVDGLGFEIVTSLSQIDGLYDEELAAYNARMEAERAADRRKRDESAARSARVAEAIEGLSAYGIRATGAWEGKQVELSVDEAEKLLAILRDREA